jgi:anti-sigma factor RsiW
MTPANLRELLTAAVDGELTPSERKTVQRLLSESASARALYAQLQRDAARIKALPRVPAPHELVDNVMGVIRERAITPTPLPPTRRPASRFDWSKVPIWANLATAASILILISIGSYAYFAASQDYKKRQEQGVAINDDSSAKNVDETANDPKRESADKKALVEKPKLEPAPEVIVHRPKELVPELGPVPRVHVPDLQVGPPQDSPEIEPFDLNKIRVSKMFALHDLAQDEQQRKKLAAEMKKDELIRLDLFCQTTPKALDLVLNALRARGINVVTDGFVQDRLRKKSATELMIFTEALTPDEVVQLLAAIGADDQKSRAGEFETLVAAPFLPADLTRLGQLLGVPNVLPKPAKGKEAVDIRKPLPEGTANHVASVLGKMGSTQPKPEKIAVVVAYSPMNPQPALSKEIKQFLDRRGERRADAKPLMLVLRTIK